MLASGVGVEGNSVLDMVELLGEALVTCDPMIVFSALQNSYYVRRGWKKGPLDLDYLPASAVNWPSISILCL